MGYVVVATSVFIFAAYSRFSVPQYPVAQRDYGYFLPALSKLGGGDFESLNGVNFLYPAFVYGLLRVFRDFRAIGILQHLLGLAAGGLFLASWDRLASFLPRHFFTDQLHRWMGLLGAGVYLLSNGPILFESPIRSDAVSMFAEMLSIWLALQFFYYCTVSRKPRRTLFYAVGTAISCFVLASLKPSFSLTSLTIVAVTGWLIIRLDLRLRQKIAFL